LGVPAKEKLAQSLTDILISMEGGANTRAGRAFAWVLFTELRTGDWWIGGHADKTFVSPPGAALAHVTVPEGYMNASHKSEVHAAVGNAIAVALGASPQGDPGASVLVVIDEVTEGNWGAGAKTISLDSIAESVGLSKSGERFQWVRDYFRAKARQFAAAGYPADTGGLPPDWSAPRPPAMSALTPLSRVKRT
jgi:phenylpyruvate tautomerase PptA (4-oxalocrotonate tautomerase family)